MLIGLVGSFSFSSTTTGVLNVYLLETGPTLSVEMKDGRLR